FTLKNSLHSYVPVAYAGGILKFHLYRVLSLLVRTFLCTMASADVNGISNETLKKMAQSICDFIKEEEAEKTGATPGCKSSATFADDKIPPKGGVTLCMRYMVVSGKYRLHYLRSASCHISFTNEPSAASDDTSPPSDKEATGANFPLISYETGQVIEQDFGCHLLSLDGIHDVTQYKEGESGKEWKFPPLKRDNDGKISLQFNQE
ncbi:MAG: hypothetical protein ABW189_05795, partial [Rickettsiales bacterium]